MTDQSRFDAFYMELFALARTVASRSEDAKTADEVAQEIGVREWNRFRADPAAYRYPENLRTFTVLAVRHYVASYHRGERRRGQREFKYEAARQLAKREWMDPHQAAQLAEMEITADQNLAAQPARRTEAFLGVYEDGQPYSVVAERLNITEVTVRVQYHRALQSLREAMFKYWKEDA